MDKQHAFALVNALEAAKVPCAAALAFNGGGVEAWTVSIPESFACDAAHLNALADYCIANGLTLSATFSYLGIV